MRKSSENKKFFRFFASLPHGSYDEDPMTEYEKSHQTSPEEDCEKKYPSCPEIFWINFKESNFPFSIFAPVLFHYFLSSKTITK